jgi:hypothetical protein
VRSIVFETSRRCPAVTDCLFGIFF